MPSPASGGRIVGKEPITFAENAGISFGSTAALNIMREFLPNHLPGTSVDKANVH